MVNLNIRASELAIYVSRAIGGADRLRDQPSEATSLERTLSSDWLTLIPLRL